MKRYNHIIKRNVARESSHNTTNIPIAINIQHRINTNINDPTRIMNEGDVKKTNGTMVTATNNTGAINMNKMSDKANT
eukprot:8281459-Pyramimonas_sp.AAC.1